MLRLIKVLRLARASRLIQKLTAKMSVHTGFIDAFKFFMVRAVAATSRAARMTMCLPATTTNAAAARLHPCPSQSPCCRHLTVLERSRDCYYTSTL